MIVSICAAILSLHFARVFAGNIYRALPAYVLPPEALARTLGYFNVVTEDNADGSKTERQIEDVARITKFERTRFFLHCLLAS